MDGVSSINAYSTGLYQLPGIGQSSAAGAPQAASADSVGGTQAGSSVSTLSVSSSVETFMETYGPLQSTNELTGALLLLLISEYMKTDDEEEKKGLLALMSALLQQAQGSGSQGSFMYSSSSLSIETSQFNSGSVDLSGTGYASAPLNPASTPAPDAPAGGLNVVI